MMEFVFPPKGRRTHVVGEYELQQEAAGLVKASRADLPDDYLGAMLDDLKSESERALKEYTEAEAALKDAIYTHEALRLEVKEERAAWKDLWAYVSSVAGEDFVENCVARAQQRAQGKIPADEVDRALLEGDLPDPEKYDEGWVALEEPKDEAVSDPAPEPMQLSVPPPAPLPAPPQTTFGGNATSIQQGPLLPAPVLPPKSPKTTFRGTATSVHQSPLPSSSVLQPGPPKATFGGNATALHDGPFLKRRRDSDVDSDSDSGDSDSGRPFRKSSFSGARKRSKKSPVRQPAQNLDATTSKARSVTPPARRSASPR
ncbi:hypothetical protein FB451DRAFT_429930 [Mycena latifolia]|nr:hypothetical protein FB451DRAFT_429930 [Mycena latifolia]